jgi:arginine repressor
MKKVCELENIKKLFENKSILSMSELQAALGTESSRTVFRYLKKLNYITSYTHAGKYYSLPEVAQFDLCT